VTASETPAWHVGFLVRDMEAARTTFSELLGVSFNDPYLVRMENFEDPDPRPTEVLITYSQQGPMHFELIEGQDNDGVWSIHQGEGLHHVALWVNGAERRLHELARSGVRSTTMMLSDARQILGWYSDPRDAHGVRVEFVDDAQRAAIEHFVATGNFDIQI
jgi:catechol 2,3-dioxygenase-like lactoylglutathione lyase family enzyme